MSQEETQHAFISPHLLLLSFILVLIVLISGQSVKATSQNDYIKVIAPENALKSNGKDIILWHDYGSFALYKIKSESLKKLSLENQDKFILGSEMDHLLFTDRATPSQQDNTNQQTSIDIYDGQDLQLIQFVGPIKDEWLENVTDSGAQLVHYIANNGYLVWTDPSARQKLQTLAINGDFLQSSIPYFPAYKLGLTLNQNRLESLNGEAPISVTLQMFRHKEKEVSEAIIAELAVGETPHWESIINYQNTTITVLVKDVEKISRLPDIVWVGEKFERELTDEVQSRILAGSLNPSKTQPGGPGYLSWFDVFNLSKEPADYPIVDIVDDGIGNGTAQDAAGDVTLRELGREDMPSRLVYIANCTSAPTGAGPDGHGHLNISIAGGFDNRQGYPYQDDEGYQRGLGVNPYGRFAGTRVFDQNFNLSGCGGTDLSLIRETYNRGARIMSNSWSCRGCAGTYDDSSQAFDAGVRDANSMSPGNQELTILFSAGNAGPDLDTIGTPGNGKNMITVGASENVRPTWIDGCGVGVEGADNVQDMAEFSSRGPAPGGRIKPDVVGPGTHIQGTASTDPVFNGSGICDIYRPSNQRTFAASSGTSHSTPALAGMASLVHTYIRQHFGITAPSPALIKGFIIAHTTFLFGEDAGEDLPNFHQGFGLPDMTAAFNETSKVVYEQGEEIIFNESGQSWTKTLSVADPEQPVRIVMTYTDSPGAIGTEPQVNDLDLVVEADGASYRGNNMEGGWSAPQGTADKVNNVEAVYLPGVNDSAIQIKVTAFNIAGDGVPGSGDQTDQDFTIVCSNCIVQPDFTMSLTPQSNDICVPGSVEYTVSLQSINEFASPVSLQMGNLPDGVNAQFKNNPIVPTAQSKLKLTANQMAPPGSYLLEVSGSSTNRNHSSPFRLNMYSLIPAAPNLMHPQNGAVDQPLDLTLTWSAANETASYEIEIATDSKFNNIVIHQSGIEEPKYLPEGLISGQIYYWRVKSSNSCGSGSFSPSRLFATELMPGACPIGAETQILYSTDFEDQTNDWSSSGINDTWALTTSRSYSDENAYYAQNLGEVSDQMLVSPAVTLPDLEGQQTLQFWNFQEIESNEQLDEVCFDGGILEISTDQGSTWSQLGGMPGDASVLITDPYDGYIDGLHQNPLGGKAAWCGDPQEWINSVVKLDAYAGQTVQFRFRLGSDESIDHEGWYIDDVVVQACKINYTDLYLPMITTK